MERLNDEQNFTFMNHPERIAAEKRLHDVLRHIQENVKFDGNAEYYLMVFPVLLKRLSDANENLNVIEARVEAEIRGII